MSLDSIRKITLEDMKEYIEKNGKTPTAKADFKAAAMVGGRYNHLKATKYFCETYMPQLLIKAKPKEPNKSDFLKDW